VGTSAAARTCLELPISSNLDPLKKESTTLVNVPPGLFCYRFTRHHVLLGGALTDGGSAVEWATRLLNLDSSSQASDACWSEVEELVESQVLVTSEQKFPSFPGPKGGAAATARSLTFVPFLSGERSTGFRDSATGCLLGLTLATRPAHLLKSCLEGVTLRLGSIVSLLRPALVSKISPAYRVDLEENHEDGASEGEDGACLIVVSGKAMEARSLWRQMLADCTGLEVVCDDEASSESTSRGVATMLALALQGGANKQLKEKALPLEELKPHRVARPCAAVAPFWERLATEQERLLDALAPIYGTGHGRPALTS
jgi:gluconokinase